MRLAASPRSSTSAESTSSSSGQMLCPVSHLSAAAARARARVTNFPAEPDREALCGARYSLDPRLALCAHQQLRAHTARCPAALAPAPSRRDASGHTSRGRARQNPQPRGILPQSGQKRRNRSGGSRKEFHRAQRGPSTDAQSPNAENLRFQRLKYTPAPRRDRFGQGKLRTVKSKDGTGDHRVALRDTRAHASSVPAGSVRCCSAPNLLGGAGSDVTAPAKGTSRPKSGPDVTIFALGPYAGSAALCRVWFFSRAERRSLQLVGGLLSRASQIHGSPARSANSRDAKPPNLESLRASSVDTSLPPHPLVG